MFQHCIFTAEVKELQFSVDESAVRSVMQIWVWFEYCSSGKKIEGE